MVSVQRMCRDREIKGSWNGACMKPLLPLYNIFSEFTCYKADEHSMTAAEEGEQVPLPFSCAFSRHTAASHIVAVANEDGKVHLIDTLKSEDGCVKSWQAHVNAVFDIAWVNGESKLVTASGDQTAQLWDVETSKCISVFKGHTCSLRSISFKHNHRNIFATGARDGNIMVWDTRNRPMKSGYFKPVNILHGVHSSVTTTANSRRPNSVRNAEAQQSVTTVLFKDEHNLYSSGAADGAVKMWDMRRYYTNAKGVPQARQVYPYVGPATRKHGISSLSMTSCGSYLFSSCTDDCIYVYNTYLQSRDPVAVLNGHTNSTFYVKSSVTCDDRYLVSGSSSHSIFVWDIGQPHLAPVKLDGHFGEVTSVTCSPTDIGQIVSCSDDNSVRIWRLHDQTSLCKDGFKCGSASTLAEHTPMALSSLNLCDTEEVGVVTPNRVNSTPNRVKSTPNRGNSTPNRVKSTPNRVNSTPNIVKSTPDRVKSTPNRVKSTPNRVNGTIRTAPSKIGSMVNSTSTGKNEILTPTRVRNNSNSTPPRDTETASSSGTISESCQNVTPKRNLANKGKLTRLQTGHSKLEKICEEPSSSKQIGHQSADLTPSSSPIRHSPRNHDLRTPGKISAYFKSSRALSSEKKSPVRQSPRLINKVSSPSVEPLDLDKQIERNPSSSISQNLQTSPNKRPKRKERLKKTGYSKTSDQEERVARSASKETESTGPLTVSVGIQSADRVKKISIGTQYNVTEVTVGTQTVVPQTLSPADCTFTCSSCCRPPLYYSSKPHTPNLLPTGGGTTPHSGSQPKSTPTTAPSDLTPRSCSSIPRPKRIHSDVPTTPTKGNSHIVVHRSPEGKENSLPSSTRKFTRTGTPIHRNNCRCTFCLSTATEVSELSSSPILEMPSRPRKRLLSHELDACQDACSKKRKSLFPGEDGLTVSQWLGSNFAAQQQLSQEPSSQESVPNTQIQELDPNTQIQVPVLTTLIQESVPSSQTQSSACINRSEELLSSNKTD